MDEPSVDVLSGAASEPPLVVGDDYLARLLGAHVFPKETPLRVGIAIVGWLSELGVIVRAASGLDLRDKPGALASFPADAANHLFLAFRRALNLGATPKSAPFGEHFLRPTGRSGGSGSAPPTLEKQRADARLACDRAREKLQRLNWDRSAMIAEFGAASFGHASAIVGEIIRGCAAHVEALDRWVLSLANEGARAVGTKTAEAGCVEGTDAHGAHEKKDGARLNLTDKRILKYLDSQSSPCTTRMIALATRLKTKSFGKNLARMTHGQPPLLHNRPRIGYTLTEAGRAAAKA